MQDVQAALSFIEDENFTPTQVKLCNNYTNDVVIVEDGKVTAVESNENPTTCSVEHTLYVKEKFGISNQAYHELDMVDLPRMYALKKEAKELDSESQIWSTPGEAIGVQQSLRV